MGKLLLLLGTLAATLSAQPSLVDEGFSHFYNLEYGPAIADFMEKCEKAYKAYEFHSIYHAVQNYCTVELSAIYLDILKDRLYTSKKNGRLRRAAQTVIYQIVRNLMGVTAPILSFLAEDCKRVY